MKKNTLSILIITGIIVSVCAVGLSVVTLVFADTEYCYDSEGGYPVCFTVYDAGYPVWSGYPVDEGYPVDVGYPVPELSECSYLGDGGYPVTYPCYIIPEIEPVNNLEFPDSSIEQLEPIEPQYVNGRNLWQEIVYQFSKLLELME